MKFILIYAIMAFLVHCADDIGNGHTTEQRLTRAAFWPITLQSWFRKHPQQLHRLLLIMWVVLISGWAVTLLLDRLP